MTFEEKFIRHLTSDSKIKTAKKNAYLEKVALADTWGRKLAKDSFDKIAWAGALRTGVGHVARGIMGSSPLRRAAVGAGGGAALGGVSHAMGARGQTVDAHGNPQQRGLLGSMARGAALGGTLGVASKPLLSRGLAAGARGKAGDVGRKASAYVRQGMRDSRVAQRAGKPLRLRSGGFQAPMSRPALTAGSRIPASQQVVDM